MSVQKGVFHIANGIGAHKIYPFFHEVVVAMEVLVLVLSDLKRALCSLSLCSVCMDIVFEISI